MLRFGRGEEIRSSQEFTVAGALNVDGSEPRRRFSVSSASFNLCRSCFCCVAGRQCPPAPLESVRLMSSLRWRPAEKDAVLHAAPWRQLAEHNGGSINLMWSCGRDWGQKGGGVGEWCRAVMRRWPGITTTERRRSDGSLTSEIYKGIEGGGTPERAHRSTGLLLWVVAVRGVRLESRGSNA
jgi:hypothetical protein